MRRLFAMAIVALLSMSMGYAAKGATKKTLEVSFNYERQNGPGSNQYAVWIENDEGKVVRTLFVTAFTSKGRARSNQKPARGYTYRPACLPTWVQHIKAQERTDEELDAVTGATPQASGRQTFVWDFKDQRGLPVPRGTYKVLVEATLFNQSIVLYTATFTTKTKAGQLIVESSLTQPEENHKDMITDVRALLK
ncbi:MAG: DUF2271 domain-containing protein [Bacteroidaceae bacterium]|nr:DUF2271 domain-containing protein [Bacteroidaceae bacterium]